MRTYVRTYVRTYLAKLLACDVANNCFPLGSHANDAFQCLDVVLVEPIIRKLKEKYPNTPITLYTAKPEIVEFCKNKPDKIELIDDNELVKDYLGENAPEQVKIDLDLLT